MPSGPTTAGAPKFHNIDSVAATLPVTART